MKSPPKTREPKTKPLISAVRKVWPYARLNGVDTPGRYCWRIITPPRGWKPLGRCGDGWGRQAPPEICVVLSGVYEQPWQAWAEAAAKGQPPRGV